MSAKEQRQSLAIDGTRLEIIATRVSDREWELSVENELKIRTTWHKLFASAEEALNAGFKAIESEGSAEFTDIEGFDYLRDDYEPGAST
ncbi:MAG: hypothetical protein ACI8W7_004367 [Gammaproteobacteria bacterium]|jgi:hypothetical protein